VVDFNQVSRSVSGKLYDCGNAVDDHQLTRASTEAITIALLGILGELQDIHATMKEGAAHAPRA
jgi:hypothetical protein